MTPVFTPFNLVGFESIYEIDKDAELEKIVSFKMLVNTCEESDRLQIIDEYLSLTYPEGSYDTEPIDIKNDVEEDPDDEEEETKPTNVVVIDIDSLTAKESGYIPYGGE